MSGFLLLINIFDGVVNNTPNTNDGSKATKNNNYNGNDNNNNKNVVNNTPKTNDVRKATTEIQSVIKFHIKQAAK